MITREGYIKFNLNWEQKHFEFNDQDFQSLNYYRQKLFKLGLIGAYTDGIGFGNLSIRYLKNQFLISGSATGNLKILSKNHYALVKDYDIKKNYIHCEGLTKASSESLSHAAVYNSNANINAIIHFHHKDMWQRHLNNLPTTSKEKEFGTAEIALEIKNLVNQNSGIIIMGGHDEGIITYGINLNKAFEIILQYFNNI